MISAFDVINLFYICAIILFIWSVKTFTFKFALFEFLTAFGFALFFETFNINFNNHYSYPNSYFYIGKVSLEVLIGWYTIYMFGKFWIITILSLFKEKNELHPKTYNYPLFILANAYVSAVVVMLIDPIASRTEWWKWDEPTPFLGVPVGEIYGIFISVVFISSLIWILYNFLSKYFEKTIYVTKNFDIYDLIIFIIYEFYCLVGMGITVIAANDNNDVMMGVTVVFLATQIMPFISIMLYFSSNGFNTSFNRFYSEHRQFFGISRIIMFVLSGILFVIVTLSILPQTNTLFPPITSLHMVLTHFFMVVFGFTIFLYLKIRTFDQSTD
jgi:uncharacterized membrane protein